MGRSFVWAARVIVCALIISAPCREAASWVTFYSVSDDKEKERRARNDAWLKDEEARRAAESDRRRTEKITSPAPKALPKTAVKTKQVDLYVTSWCPYCRKLKEFLNSRNIAYSEHDVEADASAYKIFKSLGGDGVPLAKIDDRVIKGFDTGAVASALES